MTLQIFADRLDLQRRNGLYRHFWELKVGNFLCFLRMMIFIRVISSAALYIASLAEVGQGRTLTRVEIAAIAWAVNVASGIINTVGTKAIGGMSSFNLWWTLGGTLVLVITLLVKAPVKVSSKTHMTTKLKLIGDVEFCRFRVY